MRYSLALASLVALASAAPLQHNNPAAVEDAASAKTNFSPLPPFHFVWTPNGQPPVKEKRNSKMATDIKYTKYPSYKPYGGYAPYSAVVEAEAAKEKRNTPHMAADGKYENYPSYTPYGAYGTYPSTADAAAAKMEMAKRHEMIMDIGCTEKRHNNDDEGGAVNPCWKRSEKHGAERQPAMPRHSNGAYGTYDPYSKYKNYDSYKRSEGGEAYFDGVGK